MPEKRAAMARWDKFVRELLTKRKRKAGLYPMLRAMEKKGYLVSEERRAGRSIRRAGTEPVAMPAELLDHPLAVDLVFDRVMQNV